MTIRKTEINDKNLCVVEFSEDAAVLEAEKSKVFHAQSKNFNIPGFRRGKAPRSLIEKMYGTGVFLEDAVNNIINAHYTEIVDAAGKKIVSRPEFDIVSMDENEIVLKAEMYVKPEVSIEGYKGIEASVVLAPVTDEEIEREINTVRERNAREIEITDRAAEMGDTAEIDFEGFVDGVAFDGGKGENYPLELGSNSFIPGFEEQVAGHKTGEEFDVNVTFPEQYEPSLAGKDAVFKCSINEIKTKELPELDDEFAKDVSEFDTLDELKADLKKQIAERKEANAKTDFENQIVEQICDNMEVEIPECMFTQKCDEMVQDYAYRLQMQGLDLNTYLQYLGQTMDQFKEQFMDGAKMQVKTKLALDAIVKAEGIEATEEEIEAEVAKLAEQYNMEAEQIKAAVPQQQLSADIVTRKAVDFVVENAVKE